MKQALKKALNGLYLFLTNPWVNVIVGLVIIFGLGFYINEFGVNTESFVAGFIAAVGYSIYDFGLTHIFVRCK